MDSRRSVSAASGGAWSSPSSRVSTRSKGTNVQDAMKCSSAVIEGLLKIKNSLFILSTHLYEIADALKVHPNINFNYFETTVQNEQLVFNYQLRKGISNDRFGYLILKKEGVVELLEKL